MKKSNKQLILREDDYQLLISYVNGWQGNSPADRKNAVDLQAELKKAKLVSKDNFPLDVVRLNSIVKVKATDKDAILELVLVTPDKADIRSGRISVMAPIGTALIGFRKGEEVKWDVPAGKKTFMILEVVNER